MKIKLCQLNFHIGNFESNISKIIEAIEAGKEDGAELVVFPELAITGYPPRDFLEFEEFIGRCEEVINQIAHVCKGIAAVVGGPSRNPNEEGKHLYNSAYFLADGSIQKIVHKALLPTYDVFDEYRYFEPATQFDVIEYKGKKLGITICEDLWAFDGEESLYGVYPMKEVVEKGADWVINIAASPFDFRHAEERVGIIKKNAKMYQTPIVYVNHVGAQTELIFDGGALCVDAKGDVVEELSYFKEQTSIIDTENLSRSSEQKKDKIALIHDALVLGIRDYFHKSGLTKAVIGLSGGIDSAVTFALMAEALGRENIFGVLMPSQFSSDHSIKDAEDLANNLDAKHQLFEIKPLFDQFQEVLQPLFGGTEFGLAEENLQARSRGVLLMAISNKFGYILLNTTNKSEAAVGYGTLYGDMCGGLSVLGDVYKIEVFELARYINRDEEIIPWNTINKPPSAELRPDQKDTDSLPEYDVLDAILYEYIENRKGPSTIIDMGFDSKLVNRVIMMVNRNEHKRYQMAPVLRISGKAFGMGRRMPIVARYWSR